MRLRWWDTETGEFTEKTLAQEGELPLYVQLQNRIQQLDGQVEEGATQRPQTRRLLAHSGVGPITALATEAFLGDAHRFASANKVATRFVLLTLALFFTVPICAREKTDVM